ncbi:MAG: PHP domain-containing protein [Halanaerobium sp.]
MEKIETDLHTHTVASGHGYSTIDEMAGGAFKKGIKLIALTDHGPKMPGGSDIYYFSNLSVVPDLLHGVRIIKGVEANILDDGKLDLSDKILNCLDFVSAGIHSLTGHNLHSKKDYTSAMIKVMKNQFLDMITHPIQKEYPIHLEKVAKVAAENNVILELNSSSYNPKKGYIRGVKRDSLKLLELANKYKLKLAINSDAHFYSEIGDFSNLDFIFNNNNFNRKLIVNRSLDSITNYLKRRDKEISRLKKTI